MTWNQNYTALIVSFAYVFGVIAVAELLRRVGGRSLDFTRKFIHVGVGMWIVGTVFLFENCYLALVPPLAFTIINAVSYWRGTIKSMEARERGNLGTIYFPISFAVIIYCFWGMPVPMVASLMPMTWGDAQAALVGQRYGFNRYTVFGQTRSVEGSLAMLLWSWIPTSLALCILPLVLGTPSISPLLALIYGGATALVCTLVEALSPLGIDNLTVPLVAMLVLYVLQV
ncbi:MAG: phosphatidate cytidylyltransferase [Anaerolineae bacterium]|nr:phosphatidate cytidylyltransferase [Anaerolineae bacterium]